MLAVGDHVIDGDGEPVDVSSPNMAGDHEECEEGEIVFESVDDSVLADISSEKPDLILLQDTSDTGSGASVSSSSHQISNEDEENARNAKMASLLKSNRGRSSNPPPSPTLSGSVVEGLSTATPLTEGIIHERAGNISLSEGKGMVSGGEPTALDQGIINKVEESLPLSEKEFKVSGEGESMERELADAKAENAKLREALEKKRALKERLTLNRQRELASAEAESAKLREVACAKAENAKLREALEKQRTKKKGASGNSKGSTSNQEDDSFAPREGKSLAWALISKVCFLPGSL
jgi:hypothetical protein